ncbi:hypothetical protein ACO22_04301 [Paracoccidioides brasiliensis]|uniref:Uncharacterized protein n=1 Tax=Paracoccidioides brasiliensis TaxID=121759 RepID=A0A1D2JDG6_PARBR|nr:hypothetical protein ACO22_04301 [Paracoccidioides brasiliensis]
MLLPGQDFKVITVINTHGSLWIHPASRASPAVQSQSQAKQCKISPTATAIEDIHQVIGGSKSQTDVLLGMLHSHYYQLGISPAPEDAHLFCSGSFGGAAIEARQAWYEDITVINKSNQVA